MNYLKIMYIWNDLSIGGAAQSLIDTLTIMKNKASCIVVIRQPNQIVEYLKNLEIKYYIIPFAYDYGPIGECTQQKADNSFMVNYEAAIQLQTIIRDEKISLIHINSSTSSMGAFAAILAGIPYVWHVREFLQEDFNSYFFDIDLKLKLFLGASKVITISDCVKKKYQEQYGIKTLRIYNGFNIGRYKRKIEKQKFNYNFLLAGEITKGKGQWDAVRAVEILVENGYTEIELFIIGGGDDTERWIIEKYIFLNNLEKNIHLIPFQNDLSEYRKKCSYAITSSKMEALGRVTIEAMLSGNIVIGADTGGTKEIIGESSERGYLYQQGNYRDLADVMLKALNESEESKARIQIKAQQYAEDNFNLEQYGKQLYRVYEDAIQTDVPKNNIGTKELETKYEEIKKGGIFSPEVGNESNQLLKISLLYRWTMKWLQARQKGITLGDYFMRFNIRTVAIYGMGQMGCRVYDELEKTEIQVKYVMDRRLDQLTRITELVNPENELPEVDAIIVTVLSQERELVDWLKQKCDYEVLGLSQIISQLF